MPSHHDIASSLGPPRNSDPIKTPGITFLSRCAAAGDRVYGGKGYPSRISLCVGKDARLSLSVFSIRVFSELKLSQRRPVSEVFSQMAVSCKGGRRKADHCCFHSDLHAETCYSKQADIGACFQPCGAEGFTWPHPRPGHHERPVCIGMKTQRPPGPASSQGHLTRVVRRMCSDPINSSSPDRAK